MAFIKSILFGSPGSYNTCGVKINFKKSDTSNPVFGNNWIGRTVYFFLEKPAFHILTLGYLHVFIHEMGHALAAKLKQVDRPPTIEIYTDTCEGSTHYHQNNDYQPGLSFATFVSLAGPCVSVIFELAKLAAVIALAILIPPLGIPLACLLAPGAIIWTLGEIFYATVAHSGDWAEIREDFTHFFAQKFSRAHCQKLIVQA